MVLQKWRLKQTIIVSTLDQITTPDNQQGKQSEGTQYEWLGC